MKNDDFYPVAQRGMALILSLIFLTIVTLVSLSSMQGAMTQGSMALNQQDYSVALQAAEAALQEAERVLERGNKPPATWTSYTADSASATIEGQYQMPQQTGEVIGSRVTSQGVETLEVLYRLEARGSGRLTDTSVRLEAFYVRVE
ncbi:MULTISPECIES: pilus assembly PilX N-terminal domain-containing protein [unclassified Halomonas]|uniref:pilus assembly PilX family protein n=1 Tax=unclassified Halomonas TaxID=2609666 RepID=UPI0021E41FF6|nr:MULTISPECIES: pilus assembly PilX N-terminal domain-containing protein [unclassified Halomonas]UYF99639.1 pilus assembly PilX N-terminal domain-containing protein [Halomonas sp. GD1P12]WNL39270.1 pilus assembly PilX N-terminal domain-containing protein [Halomonas sp. PAMB 3232]WNL42611.1 pilus assembly PilX N-terminal domain-containing protein [Halomonas sp. PAMB 3264]